MLQIVHLQWKREAKIKELKWANRFSVMWEIDFYCFSFQDMYFWCHLCPVFCEALRKVTHQEQNWSNRSVTDPGHQEAASHINWPVRILITHWWAWYRHRHRDCSPNVLLWRPTIGACTCTPKIWGLSPTELTAFLI